MLNNMSIFSEEILKTFIIHIPHTSLVIPNDNNFLLSSYDLTKENILSSDIDVDKIFNIPNIQTHVCGFSRLFCDVEKLLKGEVMDEAGRGIYHTKTINGDALRNYTHNEYWNIISNYYMPYHKTMFNKVMTILNENDVVRIIDAHSFNDDNSGIDVCIGTDDFHTPKYLLDLIKLQFEKLGFNVAINKPYSGTYVPMEFFQSNDKVESIMIEINKKLYVDDYNLPILSKVTELNNIIKNIFNF